MPKKTILVVDDEEDFLNLLKTTLELRGFEVITTSNAVEAGIRLASRLPSLILMDIKMPGINGLDACDAIKRHAPTKDVPIIIVSGLSDDGTIKKARRLGIVDYFVKPVNMENLIQKIREVLNIEMQV
jgi:two-component system phosphate regulon response regulator PhoB